MRVKNWGRRIAHPSHIVNSGRKSLPTPLQDLREHNTNIQGA